MPWTQTITLKLRGTQIESFWAVSNEAQVLFNWPDISYPIFTWLMWQQGHAFGLKAMQRQFLLRYFQWFWHVLLKVTFCTWFLPLYYCHFYMCLCCFALLWVKCWLPWWRWDKRSLFHRHCMGWHALRFLPLWWYPQFKRYLDTHTMSGVIGIQCWLPWWRWDKRSLFHWHCMGWQGYIWKGSLTRAPCLASVVMPYFWLFQDSQCWFPWWKCDTRSVFHCHCMGQHCSSLVLKMGSL